MMLVGVVRVMMLVHESGMVGMVRRATRGHCGHVRVVLRGCGGCGSRCSCRNSNLIRVMRCGGMMMRRVMVRVVKGGMGVVHLVGMVCVE